MRGKPRSPSDEELMLRTKAGDRASFGELMRRYRQSLYSFIYRMVGDEALSQDLYQETFLRVYRYAPRYEPRSAFSTFLYTIASNLAINEIKKRKIRRMIPLLREDSRDRQHPEVEASPYVRRMESPLDAAEREERVEMVRRAIEQLSPSHRVVIVLAEYEGLPYGEIAEIIGVPVGTVKSRINRAKARIKEWIERHEMPMDT
jgi:RNA polymerase sigma-70 factor (ECF subfamily)